MMIRQYQFLKDVLERLDNNPESVINEMNEFRNQITQPERLRIHVMADIFGEKHPKQPWVKNFLPKNLNTNTKTVPFDYARQLLTENALKCSTNPKKGLIFGLSSTESSYLYQTCVGIREFNHKDIAALLVLIEYMIAVEGPLVSFFSVVLTLQWKRIRGKGLSYYCKYLKI